ncbi:hypothetical protein LTR11_012045 [Exophiala xenobiotica]|nr:hypothetical protein LTR93_012377 [Exophiala xenobiotica]KAK5350032.1 hypothetical protein LTR11_012045 [Exophiala xenobiotica]KAK5432252.1 hypothetical protein LTR18_011236 [Exophiala xenobiotica]
MAKLKNRSLGGSAEESGKKRRRGRDPQEKAMWKLSLARESKIPTEDTRAEAQRSVNTQHETTGSLDAQQPPWRLYLITSATEYGTYRKTGVHPHSTQSHSKA